MQIPLAKFFLSTLLNTRFNLQTPSLEQDASTFTTLYTHIKCLAVLPWGCQSWSWWRRVFENKKQDETQFIIENIDILVWNSPGQICQKALDPKEHNDDGFHHAKKDTLVIAQA